MSKKGQNPLSLGLIVTILIIVGILIFMAVYTIPAGHRGVVLTWGKPSEVVAGEGLHFKWPIAQSVKKIEVRTQKIETGANSVSKDLQDVTTEIALNYHVIPQETNTLYQEVGLSYKERVIDPSIQESVKAVMAKFTAEELVGKRPQVRTQIEEALVQRLAKYYIKIDGFNIVDFQFSEEFDKAIELKVTAEQLKLKADRDFERIKVEAEQVKTQADAESYSLQKKNEAIRNSPDVVNLKKIEVQEKALDVQRQAIERWNGELPQVTGGAIPFIDMRQNDETQNPTSEESDE